jgi:hypothetical protein
MMIRDRRTMLLAAALALAVSGCGDQKGSEPRISVKGKLLESGKPFVFDQSRIKLQPGTSMPPGTGGEENTRIVRDLKDGDEIVIDIAKPQG